jgi:hypothetical protein
MFSDNLKTANALVIALPLSLLGHADKLIEWASHENERRNRGAVNRSYASESVAVASPRGVRFTTHSGGLADIAEGRFRASSGLMRRSNQHPI